MAKAKADVEATTRAQNAAKSKSDAEAKERALVEAKAKADAEAEAVARAVADGEANAKADVEAKVKAEAKTKAEADAKAKAATDAFLLFFQVDAEAKTKVYGEIMSPVVGFGTCPQAGSDLANLSISSFLQCLNEHGKYWLSFSHRQTMMAMPGRRGQSRDERLQAVGARSFPPCFGSHLWAGW